jgi:hypothetical protein
MNFDDIPQLDKSGLRKFGLTTGLIFAGLFGFLLPWLWQLTAPKWPLIVGAVLCSLALIAPRSLAPFYSLWMRLALVLGWINSRIILSLIFGIIVTPMAIVMRLLGKDPMTRKLEREKTTYRVISEPPTADSMTTPY